MLTFYKNKTSTNQISLTYLPARIRPAHINVWTFEKVNWTLHKSAFLTLMHVFAHFLFLSKYNHPLLMLCALQYSHIYSKVDV